jgi:hypothetical protein
MWNRLVISRYGGSLLNLIRECVDKSWRKQFSIALLVLAAGEAPPPPL